MHVQVALPLPIHQTFTYSMVGRIPAPGTRVLVPFQRSEQIGWVLKEGDPSGVRGIRPVLDVLEGTPSFPSELLELAAWASKYYIAPLGLTLRSMLPAVLSDRSREVLRLTSVGQQMILGREPHSKPLSTREAEILEVLRMGGGEVSLNSLRKTVGGRSGSRSFWPQIRRLSADGFLEHRTIPPGAPTIKTRKVVRLKKWIPDLAFRRELFGRSPRQQQCFEFLEAAGGACELARLHRGEGFSRAVISGLGKKNLVAILDEEVLRDPFGGRRPEAPVDHPLSDDQRQAVEALVSAVEDPASPFLLHGVTGSGKTLVYIHLLREIVHRRGQGAIVLVPEISLTPQTVSRFRAWFGDQVAVLHSALSGGERYDQWRQIRTGDKRVVVGARSALFAPVKDLGAIIVDEEHDGSYKQSETPRYHARDMAVMRARLSGALCVLGSATPSLESWRNAERGKFRLLSLPQRVRGRPMPPVAVVDLRDSRSQGDFAAEGRGILSSRLVRAVRSRLEKGEQAILLLNRRGYASFVQCLACGEVRLCNNCSVSLTFHRTRNRLICHHCRHEEVVPDQCLSCGDPNLSFRGLGTEQVERVVSETFPGARIARMDVDTTSGKRAHQEILDRVQRGEVDLLLGTQMIAKGLDFPRVTLVGVVNADVGIHLPDFRASERSFQLLSQVAGRTGRSALGGEVIIQSSLPEHYAIQAAVNHDFVGFARRELDERRSPAYPPHVRLVNVVVSSPDPGLAAASVEGAVHWILAELEGALGTAPELMGPAPSPIERLHGRWRWHFFLRGGGVARNTYLLTRFLKEYHPPSGDVRISVDRDPVALL